MTGELWWRRLVNSARFLDDIRDALAADQSSLLLFESSIPWQDIMIETIKQKLVDVGNGRTFEMFDVSKVKTPGKFLMGEYCSEDEQMEYWPTTHGNYERFLAQNQVTTLNKRYVFLTGIHEDNAMEWIASVKRYLEAVDDVHKRGVFILIARDANVAASKQITTFRYADYVTDYDCMMLCLTLVSDLKCSRAEKMYLCEVASNIANNNVEIAALLASEKLSLIQHPYKTAFKTSVENHIEILNLEEQVRMAVWEAQIRLVFPKLESFRANLIKKYDAKLRQYLPIKSSFDGKWIDEPSELEIGQLYFICETNRSQKVVTLPEFEMLEKIRIARNTLAHWRTLEYKQLVEMGSF